MSFSISDAVQSVEFDIRFDEGRDNAGGFIWWLHVEFCSQGGEQWLTIKSHGRTKTAKGTVDRRSPKYGVLIIPRQDELLYVIECLDSSGKYPEILEFARKEYA